MADFAQARRAMVEGQVRIVDVTDLRIQSAMLELPREEFVPPAHRAIAYFDREIPVSENGTRALMKPMVFAKLVQAAEIGENDRVLDVGCATGYSSAILARLAREVVALEEDAALARAASGRLSGTANIRVVTGPLKAGWSDAAPYDVIVLEGASEIAPESLIGQLAERGRLVVVIGARPMGKAMLYARTGGHATARPLFDAAAPLLPGFVKPAAFVF